GINTTWTRIPEGDKIQALLLPIEENFDFKNPSSHLPNLLKAYALVRQIEDEFWRVQKSEQLRTFIKDVAGLHLAFETNMAYATPGETINASLKLLARNTSLICLDQVQIKGAKMLSSIVEKPLERDFERAFKVVEQGKSHKIPIGVFLQHRKRPSIEILKNLIDKKQIGDVSTVEVRIPWWREQTYYDQEGRGTFERDGGGVLITQAIHTLDIMLLLCGPVKEVHGMVHTSSFHQLEAEDFSGALLNFESGARGTLMASTTHFPGHKEEIILNCSEATVNISGADLKVFYHNGKIESLETDSQTGSGSDPMDFSYTWHANVIEQFWTQFTKNQQIEISAESALPVQQLIDAIVRSSKLEKKVTV
ncbi:MAG: gfo/Idh/MocA family oxidoreductase, partial [Rhodobacterales bacterium]|nr:gfo/Idh/MocA family oxidoreductase [Rhodobacterales bacterium]